MKEKMTTKSTPIRVKNCKWCGRSFVIPKTRQYNAVKYCCKAHSYYAYLERHNKAQKEYIKRYTNCSKRLGTGYLGSHPADDFKKEYELIINELRRQKLK